MTKKYKIFLYSIYEIANFLLNEEIDVLFLDWNNIEYYPRDSNSRFCRYYQKVKINSSIPNEEGFFVYLTKEQFKMIDINFFSIDNNWKNVLTRIEPESALSLYVFYLRKEELKNYFVSENLEQKKIPLFEQGKEIKTFGGWLIKKYFASLGWECIEYLLDLGMANFELETKSLFCEEKLSIHKIVNLKTGYLKVEEDLKKYFKKTEDKISLFKTSEKEIKEHFSNNQVYKAGLDAYMKAINKVDKKEIKIIQKEGIKHAIKYIKEIKLKIEVLKIALQENIFLYFIGENTNTLKIEYLQILKKYSKVINLVDQVYFFWGNPMRAQSFFYMRSINLIKEGIKNSSISKKIFWETFLKKGRSSNKIYSNKVLENEGSGYINFNRYLPLGILNYIVSGLMKVTNSNIQREKIYTLYFLSDDLSSLSFLKFVSKRELDRYYPRFEDCSNSNINIFDILKPISLFEKSNNEIYLFNYQYEKIELTILESKENHGSCFYIQLENNQNIFLGSFIQKKEQFYIFQNPFNQEMKFILDDDLEDRIAILTHGNLEFSTRRKLLGHKGINII